jgi:type I restriction enzyme S subunit
VLKTSAVTWERYDDNQNKRLPTELLPRPHLAVQSGDILITRAGPAERTGVVAMVDATSGRRMLSDKLIRIRVDLSRAVPLTVTEILGSSLVQAQIDRVKSGMAASQTNITQKTVANLEIPLPSLSKQRRFAEFVGSLNELINVSTAQRDHLARLKSHVASDLLSGRVRVPA